MAIALIAAGEWTRRNERTRGIAGLPSAHIPSILTAVGTTIAYADVYAAYALYGFLAPAAAFLLLGVVALATLAAALLHGPALAGLGLTSCRRPEMHLVPFTKSAEWTIPGKFLYYATAMPRRTGAIPLIATTVDGRPIKLEGNPLHPASGGSGLELCSGDKPSGSRPWLLSRSFITSDPSPCIAAE